MVESKVLIGYLTQEYARRADFYDYLSLLIKPPNCMILPCHDRSPAKGRNLIIEAAFDNDCTHILFMDDDMVCKSNALLQLLEHDVDIVTGLYLSRSYPHQPLIFDLADESGACLHAYLVDDTPRLIEVVAAGFGFVLIKTDVFRRMEKPWVRLGELNQEEWCDDVGFFNRVRKVGIQSYCDTDCRIGHIGTMIIWPDKEGNKWMSGYDTYGKGTINVPQLNPDVVYKEVTDIGPSGGRIFKDE